MAKLGRYFILCRVQNLAVYNGLKVQLNTIQKCATKLFGNGVKIAVFYKPRLEVHAIQSGKKRMISPMSLPNLMVQKLPSSRHPCKLNPQWFEVRYGESCLPLLPVLEPAGALSIEESGVQAASTMVSVGYLEVTLSCTSIVFP